MTITDPYAPPTTVCYKHPDRETQLRCNRCERPMCTSCAILTPTGYRCKECVSGQEKHFDTAKDMDYAFAVIIAGVLSFIGSWIAQFLGVFTFFIAPLFGIFIAEAVRRAVKRRRSKLLYQITTGAAALGALPMLGLGLLSAVFSMTGGAGISGILDLVWAGLYLFLIVSTTYYRLSGIQIGS